MREEGGCTTETGQKRAQRREPRRSEAPAGESSLMPTPELARAYPATRMRPGGLEIGPLVGPGAGIATRTRRLPTADLAAVESRRRRRVERLRDLTCGLWLA